MNGDPHWYEIIEEYIPPLPSGYTQLTYIESTGTQYIDTGVVPTDKMHVVIRFNINSQSNYGYIFGQQEPGGAYGARLRDNTTELQLFAGTSLINTGVNLVLGTEYTLDTTLDNGTFSWSLNNVSGVQNNVNFTNNNVVMRLFSGNTSTAAPGAYLPGKDSIYEAKIYDNGTLVRDFVPAKRNSDNEIGMYDTVNNQFYTNAGSGTFVAGNPL